MKMMSSAHTLLTVLEVEGWAGPCRSILPTFKRIRLDKDDEAALQFLVVSIPAMLQLPRMACKASHWLEWCTPPQPDA